MKFTTFEEKEALRKIASVLALLMVTVISAAHPWKPSHFVIVDTDGGVDDLKAICMLLASPDVRLLAITVSNGFQSEEETFNSVRAMLDSFHHEGVPVVRSDKSCELITNILSTETTPVTFISLGSLKTASQAITLVPQFRSGIKQIIWTNDGIPGIEGFNYKYDPAAAEKVMADTIPLLVVGSKGEGFYDNATLKSIGETDTRYAAKVNEIISTHSDHQFVYSAYDELAPLLLHYPSLFEKADADSRTFFIPKDLTALRSAAIKILSGTTVKRMQVMDDIPVDTSFYLPDIQPYISDIVKSHGKEEWASGVIANELHRHLGVFAIIGVKMGIRAREYFCTGVDEFHVTSYAGSTPPLSCMNDGVQVSTGATPGHGLLSIASEGPFIPSADFTYKGKTIRLTLKKELADKILSELKEINFVFGLDSNIYWELVRKNSIKYWLLFDRNEIFEITVINSASGY